jgi:hypothetical protein
LPSVPTLVPVVPGSESLLAAALVEDVSVDAVPANVAADESKRQLTTDAASTNGHTRDQLRSHTRVTLRMIADTGAIHPSRAQNSLEVTARLVVPSRD